MSYFLDRTKITHYLLNDDHPDGGSKSRFFKGCGFRDDAWEQFRESLLRHPFTGVHTDTDTASPYGEKQTFECSLETPDGRNPCIRTVWQKSADGWRLITAYPFL